MSSQRDLVWEIAHRLHREHGHPTRYDGPCWGPTYAEWEEARELAKQNPEYARVPLGES